MSSIALVDGVRAKLSQCVTLTPRKHCAKRTEDIGNPANCGSARSMRALRSANAEGWSHLSIHK